MSLEQNRHYCVLAQAESIAPLQPHGNVDVRLTTIVRRKAADSYHDVRRGLRRISTRESLPLSAMMYSVPRALAIDDTVDPLCLIVAWISIKHSLPSLIIIALIIIGRLHLFIRFKSYITVILSAIPASDYIFIGLVRFPFLFQPCLFIDLVMASRKQGLLRNRAWEKFLKRMKFTDLGISLVGFNAKALS
jgi:hypothetical protein